MQDATDSSSTDGDRAHARQVPVSTFRWPATVYFRAGLVGVLAALSVLAVLGLLLTSGIAGVDIFERGRLERFSISSVVASVAGVFAAFFCGGWVHGLLSTGIRPRRRIQHTARKSWRGGWRDRLDVARGQFDDFAGRVE